MMITDHTKANDELAALAKKHDIEVPDSTTLVKQAKAKILDLRDESFDAAYANNQVKAHEDTIALFKKEAETVTDDKNREPPNSKASRRKCCRRWKSIWTRPKPCKRSIQANNPGKKTASGRCGFFVCG